MSNVTNISMLKRYRIDFHNKQCKRTRKTYITRHTRIYIWIKRCSDLDLHLPDDDDKNVLFQPTAHTFRRSRKIDWLVTRKGTTTWRLSFDARRYRIRISSFSSMSMSSSSSSSQYHKRLMISYETFAVDSTLFACRGDLRLIVRVLRRGKRQRGGTARHPS